MAIKSAALAGMAPAKTTAKTAAQDQSDLVKRSGRGRPSTVKGVDEFNWDKFEVERSTYTRMDNGPSRKTVDETTPEPIKEAVHESFRAYQACVEANADLVSVATKAVRVAKREAQFSGNEQATVFLKAAQRYGKAHGMTVRGGLVQDANGEVVAGRAFFFAKPAERRSE